MADRNRQTGKRSRVIDLQGKIHDLLEPRDLPEDASADLRTAVTRANQHRWTVQLKWAAITFVCVAAIGFVARLAGARHGGVIVQSLIYAVASLFFGAVGGAEAARAAGKKAVAECLKAELCPACGYSLKGLEGEERVCPECGGVWRVG
jgi:membrane protease subunit (stomatin/prohibitin family)